MLLANLVGLLKTFMDTAEKSKGNEKYSHHPNPRQVRFPNGETSPVYSGPVLENLLEIWIGIQTMSPKSDHCGRHLQTKSASEWSCHMLKLWFWNVYGFQVYGFRMITVFISQLAIVNSLLSLQFACSAEVFS